MKPDLGVAQWARELRKGSSRLALLVLLSKGESYGYEILTNWKAQALTPQGATEATVYPLLHELEAKGVLSSRWGEASNGVPPRKYYRVTKAGFRYLADLKAEWKEFRNEMENVVKHG